jgi:TRAP-type mannitol/chloroaromatic compound transport system permease small subunit
VGGRGLVPQRFDPVLSNQAMQRFLNLLDLVSERLGQLCGLMIFLMMLGTAVVVVLRYFLNVGSIPLQEAILYLHGSVIMLGIAFTLKRGGHVRVDIIHRALPENRKRWIDVAGTLLFLMPFAIFVFWSSLPYARFSWSVLEASSAPGGLPGVFLLKTLIPIMAALLFLQGFNELIRMLNKKA